MIVTFLKDNFIKKYFLFCVFITERQCACTVPLNVNDSFDS